MVFPIFGVMYKDTMLAIKYIYACYQIYKLLYRCSCSITQNIG